MIDRVNLLALAVMLLELHRGIPIGNLQDQEEMSMLGENMAISTFLTAHKLLKIQVRDGELSCGFRKAIPHFLQCYVDPTASLSNLEFVRTVGEGVSEPFEREMQVLLYGS